MRMTTMMVTTMYRIVFTMEIGGGAHRDAKSVSWDSLQGDVVELPGNPLTTLSISIIFMVRIIFLGEVYLYIDDHFL